MRHLGHVAPVLLVLASALASSSAQATAEGVGLGMAIGADYTNADVRLANTSTLERQGRTSLAWGFFVDIPLLPTFYISPAAMLYELELNEGTKTAITDIDLNFKFIVPLNRLRLGAGITAGLTTGLGDYLGHYGVLGYGALNLVSNIDAFVLVQYKELRHDRDINNIHAFVGGNFRF
ncbi:MAG: hypothetical protein AAB426_05940 [Myxococcota bacterium]